jgi:hypothetical protein
VLEGADLSALFGIELDAPAVTPAPADSNGAGNRPRRRRPRKRR